VATAVRPSALDARAVHAGSSAYARRGLVSRKPMFHIDDDDDDDDDHDHDAGMVLRNASSCAVEAQQCARDNHCASNNAIATHECRLRGGQLLQPQ